MQRRQFMSLGTRSAVSVALLSLVPKLFAGLQCTPFAPNGLQQCEAGIESTLIHYPALQKRSEWCWAACIEMVFRYYGYDVPQERIVGDTWGGVVNMPGSPQQIIQDLNRRWKTSDGRRFTASGDVYTANAITAAQDLSQDMPLILGTLGHAVVLTSLVYFRNAFGGGQVTSASVRDPWPGRGRRVLTPAEWQSINFAARIRVVADRGDTGSDTDAEPHSGRPHTEYDDNQSFEDCIQDHVDSCVDDCENNYQYSQAQCPDQMCVPHIGANRVWDRICRDQD